MPLFTTITLATIGEVAGKALVAQLVGKAAGIAWHEASLRLRERVPAADTPGQSVLERAVMRAAVRATHDCMRDLPSSLEDRRAAKWLSSHASALRHDNPSRAKQHAAIEELRSDAPEIGFAGERALVTTTPWLPQDAAHGNDLIQLAAHLAKKVLAHGAWKNRQRIRNALVEVFDKDRRWIASFGDFYLEEYGVDPQLNAFLSIVRHAVLMDEVRAVRQHLVQDEWAAEHVFQDPALRTNAEDRFHFTRNYDKFLGRDDAKAAIETELFRESRRPGCFRWMAVCGEGGTGKSRLCHEIIQEAPNRNFDAGFVNARFLASPDGVRQAATRLTRDTLLVVDYSIGSIAELPRFLADWAAYGAGNTPRPAVRLILILRNPDDPFFQSLQNRSAHKDGIAIDKAERKPAGERLVLKKLSAADTEALMSRRMERVARETGEPLVHAPDLLGLLRRFDRYMRPLFALMVADSLQRGDLDLITRERSKEEARLALFRNYLKRERREYWIPALPKRAADHDMERHENAVRLATALMGLNIDDYHGVREKAADDTRDLLPKHGRLHKPGDLHAPLIRAMTGVDVKRERSASDEKADARIAPLEPDLIGECFVIEGAELATTKDAALSLREVVELAYSHEPDRTLDFLRLAVQDYPQLMAKKKFLLPELS